jgi:hypothetical protein
VSWCRLRVQTRPSGDVGSMSGLPETGHAAATSKLARISIGRHIISTLRHSRAPSFAFSQAARNFAFASSSVAAVPCIATPGIIPYFGAAAGETGCRSSAGFSSSKICLIIFFFAAAKTSSPASSPMLKP